MRFFDLKLFFNFISENQTVGYDQFNTSILKKNRLIYRIYIFRLINCDKCDLQ